MSLISFIRGLAKAARRPTPATHSRFTRASLSVESLESRLVPYSVTGNAWLNPQVITISFVPDGTNLGGVTSNLFSTFNKNAALDAAGANNWQNQILKAAQVWAQQTNINFAVVPDDGAASGAGSYQQGDPGMGDIRISGYNFGNSTLARAYQPPPVNNYSIAGDIVFNTAQTWNVGQTYDLFTVAMHEFGHALGMDHSSSSSQNAMYPTYTGTKNGLTSDDIAGIRNIYSSNNARSADGFDAAAPDATFATAHNLSSMLSTTTLTALMSNLNIATTTDVHYYSVTAPVGTSGTLTVQVQSQGLSLLSPMLTVYAADEKTVLGSASGLNKYGTTLTVSLTNVTAGETFYIKVNGADTTAFSTGDYALALNFGTGVTPVEASPVIAFANGSPLSGGGGAADNPNGGDLLLGTSPLITGISPDNGSSSDDGVTDVSRISFSGTGPLLTTIQIYQVGVNGAADKLIGTTLTLGTTWNFNYTNTVLADGSYQYYIKSAPLLSLLGGGGVSNPSTTFTVTIDTHAPVSPVISGFSPGTSVSGSGTTSSATPTLSGTAEANSTVTIYRNGQAVGTTAATSSGAWYYTDQLSINGVYSYTATATDCAGNVSQLSAVFKLTLTLPAQSSNSTSTVGNVNTGSGLLSLGLGGMTPTLSASNLLASCILGKDAAGNTTTTTTPTLTGNAQANTVITIFDGSTILGTAVVNAAGLWTFTCPTLAKGIHQLWIEDSILLGIYGPASNVLTIDI